MVKACDNQGQFLRIAMRSGKGSCLYPGRLPKQGPGQGARIEGGNVFGDKAEAVSPNKSGAVLTSGNCRQRPTHSPMVSLRQFWWYIAGEWLIFKQLPCLGEGIGADPRCGCDPADRSRSAARRRAVMNTMECSNLCTLETRNGRSRRGPFFLSGGGVGRRLKVNGNICVRQRRSVADQLL